jgi:outer membrane cobalamin receptor
MKKLMYFLAILASPLMLFAQEDVEEVIVTANKKEQSVQEIPMNISVIT